MWTINVGAGHSSVAVKGGHLFTMGSVEREDADETVLLDVVSCIDRDSGEVVWRFSYPCEEIHFAGPRATPVVDGGRVYTLSWEGHLHCLDAPTGKLVWARNIVKESLALPGHWGFSGSPVVTGELLVLTAGSSGLALDKHSGETVWRSEATETSLPTPLLLSEGSGQLVVIPGGEAYLGIDVSSGEVHWSVPRERDFYVGPTLVEAGLFVPGTEASALLDVGSSPPEAVMHSSAAGFSAYQEYVVVGGHAYGFRKNYLQCIDIISGNLKWRTRIGAHGSIAASDGMLIILRGDGVLSIAEASADEFREISSTRIMAQRDNRGVPQPSQWHCWTRPVLSEGRIVARSNQGDLVCVDMRPEQEV